MRKSELNIEHPQDLEAFLTTREGATYSISYIKCIPNIHLRKPRKTRAISFLPGFRHSLCTFDSRDIFAPSEIVCSKP